MSELNFGRECWDGDNQDGQTPDVDQLELLVRAASEYVRPSDDLRPSTLEAAREACLRRRTNKRMSGLTIAVLLVAATGLPTLLLAAYPSVAVVHSAELHNRAARSVVEDGIEANWALYEALSDLRREHSALLNSSD